MSKAVLNYKKMINKLHLKHIYKLCILFIIITFINGCSSSKPTGSSTQFNNYVYEYENNAPIVVKHTAAITNTGYSIYLLINVRRLRTELSVDNFYKNIRIGYIQKNQYEGENIAKVDSIPFSSLSIQKVKDAFLCKFSISRNADFPPYLFIEVEDRRTDFRVLEDIPLETEGKSNYWKGVLYSLEDSMPVFDSFVKVGGSYKLVSDSDFKNLYINYIKNEFPPAPAPMSASKNVQKKLNIDSIYPLTSPNNFTIDTTGLYLIQEDTASNVGLAFRAEAEKFPKYTKIGSLIKPLVYISTTEEIRSLTKSTEQKKAFDNYWLKHAGNANDGKRLIKVFYDRVEEANLKFTGYKEGWKTDMGMIYLIFGAPSFVFRKGEQEQWIYEKSEGMSEVKFTFAKIPNLYSNKHYELIRYPEYEEYWYKKVELWRKGVPGI